jgi:hypothetical protein
LRTLNPRIDQRRPTGGLEIARKFQNGIVYAICHIASVIEGGSGGSGIPSATNAPFPGGNGGSGMPSATRIGVAPFVVVF